MVEVSKDGLLPVTEADRAGVLAFQRVMLARLMSDVKSQRPKLGDDEGDAGTLIQAFARHRIEANATLQAERDRYRVALEEVTDLFSRKNEDSFDRFERLAAMFRRDTGFLAPGKDQPMGGADQPDGDELRAIYDAWFSAKITRARAALSDTPTVQS